MALLRVPGDTNTRTHALWTLLHLLAHKYPRVRVHTAHQLLEFDEQEDDPNADIDKKTYTLPLPDSVRAVLRATDWSAASSDSVRLARDSLYDLLAVS